MGALLMNASYHSHHRYSETGSRRSRPIQWWIDGVGVPFFAAPNPLSFPLRRLVRDC